MKEQLKKILPRNRFARNVSILAGGTFAGQAVVVVASPLLTRVYSPEDFGVLAVYASLLAIMGVIASLRYQLAIPLPEKDEEAAHVAVLSLLVVLGMTLFTALVVAFFRESLAQTFNVPVVARYLWLLPLGLFLAGIYEVFNCWAIRIKAFPAIARTKLTQSLSMVGVQLGGFILGPLALILGHVSGQAAGNTSLGMLAIRNQWSLFCNVGLQGVIRASKRYRGFPIFSTWGGAFNMAGTHLPPLLFAASFSASAAGIYMLANRVLSMPMQLIGRAISDVFFSNAAEANRNNQLGHLVANIHEKLAQIAMPPTLVLLLAGPELFTLIFGPDWRQAGVFTQWMSIYIYFQFITSPLSQIISVLEKQLQGALFQTTLMLTQLTGLIIGSLYSSLIISVALFSIGSAFCYIGFFVWIIKTTKNNWSIILLPIPKSLAWSLPLVSPLIIFHLMNGNSSLWLISTCLTIALVSIRYFILMKRLF